MNTSWIDFLGGQISYYDAGGVRTRCLEAGQGETVFFLHGIGGHAEAFVKNVTTLSKHYRVVAVDLLGHGLTDKPDCDYEIPDYVQHMKDLMKAMGVEKAHFVGESLGGWVSFWLAYNHPELVHSFISVTGAGLLVDDFDVTRSDALKNLRNLSKRSSATEVTRDSVRERLKWLFYEPEKSITEELVEIRYRLYANLDWQRIQPKIQAMMDPERATKWYIRPEHLQAFTVPTYIVWTRHNPSTPWQTGERASKLVKGAKFDLMEDCGHWPQWEQPEEFDQLIHQYILSLKSSVLQ
ncbi:pimeloyl-ACP methyl ester carboxylesterase [Neobacillus niacini]|uniref:alpha/beta fold hydrolase n=1 Tax=Neobacillus niacini TaxID=86668 RepID=UPI0028571680|nr:alpha/beta hydrolase [Neobacillus niacini]MDR7075196.1 pimeloyl-ACP methyl ester carboxylesterase [Neobacillus niacini]